MTEPDAPPTIDVARRLHADGWAPLPLPARAKTPPPGGYTGYSGRYPTRGDIDRWDWTGNIALRLPPDVVGIDIDVYHGGSIAELEDRFGPLPATVWSTSRDDGSGIALYRVPNGTTLATNPATGVDMIQAHHRYMVVAPSIHPEGRRYAWVDEAAPDEQIDGPPPPDELPELPWAWVDGLTVVKAGAAVAATPDEVHDFIDQHAASARPGRLRGVQTALDGYQGSRHDTLVETACWALREAAAGCYTATAAIETLHAWWRRVMDDPERRDGGEFGAVIRWAVAQVVAEPERVTAIATEMATPPNIDPTTGEIIVASSTHLPAEFWAHRPVFGQIRQAAHSRLVSADAVLAAVLARVVMLTPPTLTLPAIVGSRCSLNLFCAIIDASGGGKSAAVAVARELLPHTRTDIADPILPSSGEGLIEAFMGTVDTEGPDGRKTKERRQVKTAGLAWVDEGQGLLAQADRSGSTIMETIRSAWMGGDLGQHNATEDRRRWLKAHRYRLCMIVGFQLAYAAGLIADGEGGTPQRFTFALASDPTIDPSAEWPGTIAFAPPPSITGGHDIDFDADIAAGIRERRLTRSRGDVIVDPLDTHADLRRCKLAAALALLDGRTNVSHDDWELASEIDDTSCAVRTMATTYAHAVEARSEAAYTRKLADRAAAVEDNAERRALESGAKSIARRVHKEGGVVSKRTAMAAVAGKHKQVVSVDDMLVHAESKGWIEAVSGGWQAGESRPS